MARQDQMRRLFVLQGKAGITEEERHDWATSVLNRPVMTYTSLTVDELDVLAAAAERIIEGSQDERFGAYLMDQFDESDDVMCGAPCPDGWPCVVDVGHIDRGEDHAREDGLAWAVR